MENNNNNFWKEIDPQQLMTRNAISNILIIFEYLLYQDKALGGKPVIRIDVNSVGFSNTKKFYIKNNISGKKYFFWVYQTPDLELILQVLRLFYIVEVVEDQLIIIPRPNSLGTPLFMPERIINPKYPFEEINNPYAVDALIFMLEIYRQKYSEANNQKNKISRGVDDKKYEKLKKNMFNDIKNRADKLKNIINQTGKKGNYQDVKLVQEPPRIEDPFVIPPSQRIQEPRQRSQISEFAQKVTETTNNIEQEEDNINIIRNSVSPINNNNAPININVNVNNNWNPVPPIAAAVLENFKPDPAFNDAFGNLQNEGQRIINNVNEQVQQGIANRAFEGVNEPVEIINDNALAPIVKTWLGRAFTTLKFAFNERNIKIAGAIITLSAIAVFSYWAYVYNTSGEVIDKINIIDDRNTQKYMNATAMQAYALNGMNYTMNAYDDMIDDIPAILASVDEDRIEWWPKWIVILSVTALINIAQWGYSLNNVNYPRNYIIPLSIGPLIVTTLVYEAIFDQEGNLISTVNNTAVAVGHVGKSVNDTTQIIASGLGTVGPTIGPFVLLLGLAGGAYIIYKAVNLSTTKAIENITN